MGVDLTRLSPQEAENLIKQDGQKSVWLMQASGHGNWESLSEMALDTASQTFEEAFKDGGSWCSHADTIGGGARVVHGPSRSIVRDV